MSGRLRPGAWKPINWRGAIYYDPRKELRARARTADDLGDAYVAIPIELAIACADIRECGERTTLTHDEDGPLPEPVEIQCRKPRSAHPRITSTVAARGRVYRRGAPNG